MMNEEVKAKYKKKKVPHEWRKTDRISALVSTFLGSGTLPKMPGTWGSLAAALCAYPMAIFFGNNIPCISWFNPSFLVASVIVFFAAIPFVNKAMRDCGTEDPGWIVIDEVAGQWLALAFVPTAFIVENVWVVLVAFALFRLFDITKPLGIHRFEKFPEGWGVMADDMLGGLYAGLLLAAGYHCIPMILG